jgi:hypothetical protein
VTQVVKHLPSKCEALSSNPSVEITDLEFQGSFFLTHKVFSGVRLQEELPG